MFQITKCQLARCKTFQIYPSGIAIKALCRHFTELPLPIYQLCEITPFDDFYVWSADIGCSHIPPLPVCDEKRNI